MSKEESELWGNFKEEKKRKKQSNYEKSKQLLQASGVEYTEKENGHFIVHDFDIWLTTGLFIDRKTGKRGRGIQNLIKKVRPQHV